MKLIIAGGRNFKPSMADIEFLNTIKGITEVVSGGAKGADKFGELWALEHKITIKQFHADWDKHGKCAGPIRNKEMADYADAVVLFPGGAGTRSMHIMAVNAKILIYDRRT